jgi:hypothetical protein
MHVGSKLIESTATHIKSADPLVLFWAALFKDIHDKLKTVG